MADILEEFANYLQAQGIATKGKDLLTNRMPAVEDPIFPNAKRCVVLFETPGRPTTKSSVIPDYNLQVYVRSDNQAWGRAKARAIYDKLHGQKRFINTSALTVTQCRGVGWPPIKFVDSSDGYWRFIVNYDCTVKGTSV